MIPVTHANDASFGYPVQTSRVLAESLARKLIVQACNVSCICVLIIALNIKCGAWYPNSWA
eukprot:3386297-Amphidinium_carterae.1